MSAVSTDVAAKQTTMQALKPAADAPGTEVAVGFTSLQAFALLQRVATMFSNSSIVPQRFQNNIANCAIAVEMAYRLRASPIMVMQNLYVVHGMPAWAAKFLIACFNQCGRYTSIKYAFQGTPGKDEWGCRATSTELSTGDKLEGPLITIELAKKEGWYGRKDSKWQTMPEQMLRYRSAAWFINTTAPEISMGLRTDDEIGDTFDATRGEDGTFRVTTETLREAAGPQPDATPASQPKTPTAIEVAAALDLIKNADTIGGLDAAWSAIVQNFNETKREIPLEVDAAEKGRREAINQKL